MNRTIKRVINSQLKAIESLLCYEKNDYEQILQEIFNCNGKLILIGIGKSGHIAKKLAATFASTGTPSFFVHAAEAMHGDFGMIEKNDLVVLISNSGTSAEIIECIPCLKRIGCKTVAFTGNLDSPLALQCDFKITYQKPTEADALNLAPTSSSTMTLVLGDAIACAVSELRGFTKEDFYKFHPGGSLGDKLKKEI